MYMAPEVMNHTNNWMPSVQMPPLGFGVIMPQPGGAGTLSSFPVTNQTGNQALPIAGQDNIGAVWQYKHFNVGQQIDATSQQVLIAQQKAAHDQKLMYDKMMKQKQFDEQKQRLKELGSRIKKGGNVSADAMIQNIFEKQNQHSGSSKLKPKKDYSVITPALQSKVDKVTTLGQQCNFSVSAYPNQSSVQGLPVFSTMTQPQPSLSSGNFASGNFTKEDLSKISSIPSQSTFNNIGPTSFHSAFSNHTNASDLISPLASSSHLVVSSIMGQHLQTSAVPCSTSSTTSATMMTTQYAVTNGVERNGMPLISSTIPPSASSQAPDSTFVVNHCIKNPSLNLPSWLTDEKNIPEIYLKASALVQAEADWVDTSRAYMLLMQTNVPPHFLGVLWEMVNKTQPGRLKVREFHALLALVACVQSGRSFVNIEVLSSIEDPIYPLIDHPVLLPLGQKEIQKLQNQHNPQGNNTSFAAIPSSIFSSEISKNLSSGAEHNSELAVNESVETPVSKVSGNFPAFKTESSLQSQSVDSYSDFDDFDDFVSAPPVSSKESAEPALETGVKTSFSIAPPPLPNKAIQKSNTLSYSPDNDSNITKNSSVSSCKSNPVKNLPILGNSPLNHSKNKEIIERSDDEFDDFQSAPIPSHESALPTSKLPFSPLPKRAQIISEGGQTEEKNKVSEESVDKYAVFRDLLQEDNPSDSQGEISKEDANIEVPFETNFPVHSKSGTYSLVEENIRLQNEKDLSNIIVSSALSFKASRSNSHTLNCSTAVSSYPGVISSNLNEWYSADPFGEFDSKPGSQSLTEGSSESSNYITANASADTSNDDDDFGDFVGPSELKNEKPNNFAVSAPSVSELMSETHSVASLELPGLELTVNLASSDNGSIGSRSEVSAALSKCYDWHGAEKATEEQFQNIRLEDDTENIAAPREFGTEENSLTLSSVPLTDKYSMIREEDFKSDLIEPHIDLWKRCLEGCKKLLEEGLSVVSGLRQNTTLLKQVLETSQMNDYISNLNEVWRVGKRIAASNGKGDCNPDIKSLSSSVHQLWVSICRNLEREIKEENFWSERDVSSSSSLEGCEKTCCNLCLSGGDVSLVYGGHSYHLPCANLWLNIVDLTLPLVSNSRPTLL